MKKILNNVFLFLIVGGTLVSPQFSIAKKFNYAKHLKEWTRDHERFQRKDFHASLKWHATLLSQKYLKAQAREAANIYDYNSEEKDKFLEKQIVKFHDKIVFFVSFYAYNYNFSDLSTKNANWQVRLLVDGKKIKPSKIEKIPKPDPILKRFFPYVNPWSRHYFIYFDDLKPEQFEKVSLKVNGPSGFDQLDWDMD